jgi:hypothetical protein
MRSERAQAAGFTSKQDEGADQTRLIVLRRRGKRRALYTYIPPDPSKRLSHPEALAV